jgi:hypothetical protein
MRPDPSAKTVKKALYNLTDDPHELENLLADNTDSKTYDAKVAELETCFQKWMTRTSQSRS